VYRVKGFVVAAIVIPGVLAGFAIPAAGQAVTAFEGGRLIVGDGRVIENATLVVDGTQAGSGGQGRGRPRAHRRQARESRRQDRDADDHRHPRPSKPPRAMRSCGI